MRRVLVYKDRAGNKLYKTYIKSRKVWQYYGKNAEGGTLGSSGLNTMFVRAGIKHPRIRRNNAIQTFWRL